MHKHQIIYKHYKCKYIYYIHIYIYIYTITFFSLLYFYIIITRYLLKHYFTYLFHR